MADSDWSEPGDARRQWAEELAERLARPEGLRLARLLQAAGTGPADSGVDPEPAPRPPSPPPWPIGIWQPRRGPEGIEFVRPDPSPLGDHFATRKVLRPKRSELPLRVALFGESAAAGYLYAPHLTPARVLEEQLLAAAGPGTHEVVDLARTNECLAPLAATVEAALQIQPDLLVVWTGNNWNLLETPEVSPYVPSVAARQRYAAALRDGGLAGPVALAREERARRAEAALGRIAAVARAVGIPVVLVVPEVSLADWESRQPVPWLPGDGTARWHALYAEARAHLDGSAWEEAAAAAREMLALDGGLCPSSRRLLARAEIGRGRLAEAERACRAEVDAAAYPLLAFLGAPQAGTADQELLRAAARRHGFLLVDLPRVFAEHTGSPLPGRRLFLDYCHLTAEGMQVAMAAVAAEVLRFSADAGEDWRSLLARLPAPRVPPEAEAVARLGAALHGAHRLVPVGDKAPFLAPWLDEALAASPGMEAAMLDLVAARAAPLPALLTAAQRRNLDSPHRLQLQHGWRWEHLDADVLAAIRGALERAGSPAAREVDRLLLAHHEVGPEGTDLTQPPCLWDPLERFYPDVMELDDLTRRAVHRCPWPEASFALVTTAAADVELEATVRLPAIEGHPGARRGTVTVVAGGAAIGTIAADERWRRATVRIPRERLRPGLNRVTLSFPPPPPLGEAALAAAVARLELGIEADLHPVFGELFSLVARTPI